MGVDAVCNCSHCFFEKWVLMLRPWLEMGVDVLEMGVDALRNGC